MEVCGVIRLAGEFLGSRREKGEHRSSPPAAFLGVAPRSAGKKHLAYAIVNATSGLLAVAGLAGLGFRRRRSV